MAAARRMAPFQMADCRLQIRGDVNRSQMTRPPGPRGTLPIFLSDVKAWHDRMATLQGDK
jgi:hypothetical protein